MSTPGNTTPASAATPINAASATPTGLTNPSLAAAASIVPPPPAINPLASVHSAQNNSHYSTHFASSATSSSVISNNSNSNSVIKPVQSGSGSSAPAAPPAPAAPNKFSLDLKPAQPSPIVQRLLSRKSVFDEDSKRLETAKTVVPGAEGCHGVGGMASHEGSNDGVAPPMGLGGHLSGGPVPMPVMSVGSVNFNNTISTLSDRINASASGASHSLPPVKSEVKTEPYSDGDSVSTVPSLRIDEGGDNQVKTEIKSEPTAALPAAASANNSLLPAGAAAVSVTGTVPKAPIKTEPPASNKTPAPLPSVIGTSTTTTPIKPLVDVSKARAVAVTKPSATVTPTFKNSTSTTSSQAGAGGGALRGRPGLTTTSLTKTLPSASTSAASASNSAAANAANAAANVEKGEASSTTSRSGHYLNSILLTYHNKGSV